MPDPVTISIPETHDRAELPGLLRVIASQIEDDYREGYHPRWLVTPAEPRYIAHFNPEVWVRDNAVDADPEGEQEWDCTEGLAAMHPDYRAELLAEMTADEDGSVIDRHDALKSDPNAPDWVRAWHGPFTIRVRLADPTT